ncbi:MAG: hypothetical protein A3F46_06230 [Legionellales bacterium RIFCSPHIGHO2_12_FULL_42_9]|nr:MAG: hypothetical protein A3F46_06230 [Legionellales bacterium RIFCSPHIGHO2_12_FULL_42_9]
MTTEFERLKQWVDNVALSIDDGSEPDLQIVVSFLTSPDLAFRVVDLLAEISEDDLETRNAYYSACIYALDTCVAQLYSAKENDNKLAQKVLKQLMSHLALALRNGKQTLSYWLPVLNAFYDVHVELSPELQDAYLDLAEEEPVPTGDQEINHLEVMREMILEMSNLSVFDIAENFFAQSYAMPPDFFSDLIVDLYNIPEAQDIALLTLLYPRMEVREFVIATFDQLIDTIVLTPIALNRLQVIKDWYPADYHEQFNQWIKIQRKKGVVFQAEKDVPKMKIYATEVDGAGAQGFYIWLKERNHQRLCGLLVKIGSGVKDVWITPEMAAKDIARNFAQINDGTVTVREVDADYLSLMVNHFLAITLQQNGMPDLHFLQIVELIGMHFKPELINVPLLLDKLCVQINPFTPALMQQSFKRSKLWSVNKKFTESWYLENANVDKLVNRCSSITNGIKICDIARAMNEVFNQEIELHRDVWCFHFLWMALWAQSGMVHKNEKIGLDCLLIAYAISQGTSFCEIPIMNEICRQTVINSVETMNDRRTHLNRE